MTINSKIVEHLAKFGITIEEDLGTFIASHDGKEVARGTNVKAVGKAAIAATKPKKVKPAKPEKPAKPAKPAKSKPKKTQKTEEEEGGNILPNKYRAKYAEHGGNCGDELAQFLTRYRESGTFDGKGFIALMRENSVNVGEFDKITKPNAELPKGFMGRARMTLSNQLRRIVRGQGFLMFDGKKRKMELS